jgi:hypothetical protein
VFSQQSRAHEGAGPPVHTGGSVSVIVGALRNEAAPEDRARRPWAYLITFSCYGTKLHGRQSGSVDRNHNAWKGRYVDPNRSLRSYEHGLLKSPCGRLDVPERTLVLKVIKNVCSHEEWITHAIHVRTNHVHLVVAAEINPAALMGKLKAYASRALNSKAVTKRNAGHVTEA